MLEKFQRLFRNFALFAALGLFAACGGGGDDGGGDNPEVVGDSISYTGSIDAADINIDTTDNALELSTKVVATAAMVVDLGILANVADETSGNKTGDCGGGGGLVSWNFVVDTSVPIEFSGTINFDDYCEGGITRSGLLDITSGKVDITTGLISFTTATTASLLIGDATGKVYRLQDYVVEVAARYINGTITTLYIKILKDSRLYHPDHGYVLVLETMSLKYSPADAAWPSVGGVVEIIEDATVLPVPADSAILTALDSNVDDYQFDIDIDNDGSIEFTDTGLWPAP